MTDHDPHHLRILEAVLFASADPVTEHYLAARLPEDADLQGLLQQLRDHYEGRGVNLVQSGKSWGFRTATDLAGQLVREREVARKLSRAAIETLAIVAYHQPVTRSEIEEVRGVGLSKGTLDVLFEEGWIRPKGKRRTPGRPVTWGTTDAFLDHFGLESLKDLPGVEELKATGLLDARPSIEAYSVRGQMKLKGETGNGDADGENGAEEDLLDPLDPDGDDIGGLEEDFADLEAEDSTESA